jgi:hypothetical protein
MGTPMESLPHRPLTRAEVRAIDATEEIECPTLWTDTTTTDEEEEVRAVLLCVNRAVHELSYEDGWTRQVLTDDVTELESFAALELAVHARLQDTLAVPNEHSLTLVRNDSSRSTV